MKKCIYLIALCAIFSCSKSNSSSSGSNSGYNYSANFDGQQKTFNTQVSAVKSKITDDMYALVITGIANSEQSAISLWSDKDDFTAGNTYSTSALNGTAENLLAYVSPLGSSDPANQWTTSNSGAGTEQFSCTITEATSTYIKGTFSGTLYNSSTPGSATKSVTNGQFYAKF
jgi:hypothetical protein